MCSSIVRFLSGAAGAALFAIALAAPASADERDSHEPPPPSAGETETEDGLRYDVAIVGIDDERLLDLVNRSAQLVALAGKPTVTVAGLRRRIEGDRSRFADVLRSEGYYAASLETALDRTAAPLRVTVTIDPGPRYVFGSFDVAETGTVTGALAGLDTGSLGIKVGDPARAEAVVAAERRVLKRLRDGARPLARKADRRVTVNHGSRTVSVRLDVDAGPFARFGTLAILGLERTDDAYVRARSPWGYRDPYDQGKVDAYRADMLATGLFSSVVVAHAGAVDANGDLPVTVEVVEAEARTVGAGVHFDSSEGPGGSVFWEHRNLAGRNEDLRIELSVAAIAQSLGATFRKPDFRRRDQELVNAVTLTRTDSDAFEELGVEGSVGVRWPVNDTWRGSMGATIEFVDLEDEEGEQRSTIFGLPIAYTHDGTDSVLDPTAGTRLRLALTPFVATDEELATFLVTRLGGSAYFPLDADRRFVLAGRARVGSIVGERADVVPASKRFSAGGGGSIRGYEFQSVGSLDAENDPLGGRSLLEVGAELRVRVFGDIGLVPFIEGGNVTDGLLPDFDDDLQWAAGLGLRYHTAVGPLRFDIGFPLNRRVGIDDRFQFYLSLGQAY